MDLNLVKESDIKEVMNIIEDAKLYFKNEGIPQWQNGYPNVESIKDDISKGFLYKLSLDGKILAIMAAVFGIEETYGRIYQGSWLTEDEEYLTLHRVAVSSDMKGKGLAGKMFNYAENLARKKDVKSIRIDTHKDNKAMNRLIEKSGFKYCGIIYVADGERLAYEKII